MDEVPDSASLNSQDDTVEPMGSSPSERVWVVLEDGCIEEDRGYEHSEDEARDAAWSWSWARWEAYTSSTESEGKTFAQYRAERRAGHYDYAPVYPGPQS